MAWPAHVLAQDVLPTAPYPVGMAQVEYVDPADGGRPLDYMLIYPAAPDSARHSCQNILVDQFAYV